MNKQQIEKDNNEILEQVMDILQSVAYEEPKNRKEFYEYYKLGSTGEVTFYKTREEHLQFIIGLVIDQLYEHNYFYKKEGIDKYKRSNGTTLGDTKNKKLFKLIHGLKGD